MLRTITLLALLSLPLEAQRANLSGNWTGWWKRGADTLFVSMNFGLSEEGYSGSFSSDRLRVIDIPLGKIATNGTRVSWKIIGDATTMTFTGKLRGNVISGNFEENGARGTFRLEHDVAKTSAVREEHVSFKSGYLELSGTLLLPASKGRFPAVVFIHGSGAEGRWASKYLARQFAKGGIAALIFDKRGTGHSNGDWRVATYDDLAADALAAIAHVRKHPEIDPDRVGIHGHSQGGTLAPLIATKAAAGFVIASAAAGLPMDQVEIYSLENSVNIGALSADDATLARMYITALVGAAYRGEPRKPLATMWEQVREKPWVFPPPPDDSHYWAFSRNFNTFEPAKHWRKVSVPVLLVYGEADQRVPPSASASAIAKAVAEGTGKKVEVHTFPGADHSFRVRSKGKVWPTTAPGYPDLLIDWTRRVTAQRGQ